MKNRKRLLSIVLCLCMLLTLIPSSALAYYDEYGNWIDEQGEGGEDLCPHGFPWAECPECSGGGGDLCPHGLPWSECPECCGGGGGGDDLCPHGLPWTECPECSGGGFTDGHLYIDPYEDVTIDCSDVSVGDTVSVFFTIHADGEAVNAPPVVSWNTSENLSGDFQDDPVFVETPDSGYDGCFFYSFYFTAVSAGDAFVYITLDVGVYVDTMQTIVDEYFVIGSGEPDDVSVTGVELSPSTLDLVVGDTRQLTATVAPADATDPSVVWSSDDPSIASVSDSGLVTALQIGQTSVRVTTVDGSFTAVCAVGVEAPVIPVENVTLQETQLTMTVGDSYPLTAEITPADATDKTLSYSSSDTTVATVDASGTILAVAPGAAVVTVTASSGVFATCSVTVITEDLVALDSTNFPDYNFRSFLSAYDKNSDGSLSRSEISDITRLNCLGQSIASLQGVEFLTALTYLNCQGNLLGTLDLSHNTALTEVICCSNSLTSLNVSGCAALTELTCYGNSLSSLNVSSCTALTELICYSNSLTALDVSHNSELTYLSCYSNALTSLDVSQNAKLQVLSCSSNELGTLIVTNAVALDNLSCQNNRLQQLDLSSNVSLTRLNCESNLLGSLDISHNTALVLVNCVNNCLHSLSVQNNRNLTYLRCEINSIQTLDISHCANLINTYEHGSLVTTTPADRVPYYLYCGDANSDRLGFDSSVELVTEATMFTITCSPTANGLIVSDKARADSGSTVTITAGADTGYALKSLSVNGTALEVVDGVTSYQFTMPEANALVTAEFTKIFYNINLTVDTPEGGSVKLYVNGTESAQHMAAYNDILVVELTPAPGYKSNGVSGINTEGTQSYSRAQFRMPAGQFNLVARFLPYSWDGTVKKTAVGAPSGTSSVLSITNSGYNYSIQITSSDPDGWVELYRNNRSNGMICLDAPVMSPMGTVRYESSIQDGQGDASTIARFNAASANVRTIRENQYTNLLIPIATYVDNGDGSVTITPITSGYRCYRTAFGDAAGNTTGLSFCNAAVSTSVSQPVTISPTMDDPNLSYRLEWIDDTPGLTRNASLYGGGEITLIPTNRQYMDTVTVASAEEPVWTICKIIAPGTGYGWRVKSLSDSRGENCAYITDNGTAVIIAARVFPPYKLSNVNNFTEYTIVWENPEYQQADRKEVYTLALRGDVFEKKLWSPALASISVTSDTLRANGITASYDEQTGVLNTRIDESVIPSLEALETKALISVPDGAAQYKALSGYGDLSDSTVSDQQYAALYSLPLLPISAGFEPGLPLFETQTNELGGVTYVTSAGDDSATRFIIYEFYDANGEYISGAYLMGNSPEFAFERSSVGQPEISAPVDVPTIEGSDATLRIAYYPQRAEGNSYLLDVSTSASGPVTVYFPYAITGLTYNELKDGTVTMRHYFNGAASDEYETLQGVCTPYGIRFLMNGFSPVVLDWSVPTAPEITVQPLDIAAQENDVVYFTAAAQGTGLSYQWEFAPANKDSWTPTGLSGNQTPSLRVTATAARSGMRYRCVITAADGGSVTSNAALLTLAPAVTITAHPIDVAAQENETVYFTVTAEGEGLAYQWEYASATKDNWAATGLSGNQTPSLRVTAIRARSGMRYRCVITAANGSALTSNAAQLTLAAPITITTQPADIVAQKNEAVFFTVSAKGAGLSYQWEFASAGKDNWAASGLSGNQTPSLRVTATTARSGMRFRCVITDAGGGTLTSNAASLTLGQAQASAPAIITQPESVAVPENEAVYFTVTAEGANLTYQWEFASANNDNWAATGLSGNQTPSLRVTATAARSGMRFRCVITDANGGTVTSDAAQMTLRNGPTIVKQPQDIAAQKNAAVYFTAVADSAGLTYQWEYASATKDNWAATGLSGNQTPSLRVTATEARSGMRYRCVITDTNGGTVTSDAAQLTLAPAATITAQPADVDAQENEVVYFSVAAQGVGLTYQWEYASATKDNWATSGLSGNQTPSLRVTATKAREGMRYRCVITAAGGGTLTTEAATLTLALAPPAALIITTQPTSIAAQENKVVCFTVEANGSGLTYQWEYASAMKDNWAPSGLSGNKTASLRVTATAARDGVRYRCVITDVNGATVTSNAAQLTLAQAHAIKITSQPQDIAAQENTVLYFTVVAEGEGLSYQWEYASATKDNWAPSGLSGNKTASLRVTATQARSGVRYRCVITDANGSTVTSDAAQLTLTN